MAQLLLEGERLALLFYNLSVDVDGLYGLNFRRRARFPLRGHFMVALSQDPTEVVVKLVVKLLGERSCVRQFREFPVYCSDDQNVSIFESV